MSPKNSAKQKSKPILGHKRSIQKTINDYEQFFVARIDPIDEYEEQAVGDNIVSSPDNIEEDKEEMPPVFVRDDIESFSDDESEKHEAVDDCEIASSSSQVVSSQSNMPSDQVHIDQEQKYTQQNLILGGKTYQILEESSSFQLPGVKIENFKVTRDEKIYIVKKFTPTELLVEGSLRSSRQTYFEEPMVDKLVKAQKDIATGLDLEVFSVADNNGSYLFTTEIPGKPLREVMTQLSLLAKVRIAVQLCEQLAIISGEGNLLKNQKRKGISNSYILRNIHEDNILFDPEKNQARFINFNNAINVAQAQQARPKRNQPADPVTSMLVQFVASEDILDKENHKKSRAKRPVLFSKASDIYALGLLLSNLFGLNKYRGIREFSFIKIESLIKGMLSPAAARPNISTIIRRFNNILNVLVGQEFLADLNAEREISTSFASSMHRCDLNSNGKRSRCETVEQPTVHNRPVISWPYL